MSLRSTPTRYGSVAITIHWASAIGVVAALTTGLLAAGSTDPDTTLTLVRGHVVSALSVLALTVLRVVWWIVADRRPRPVEGQPRAQELAARVVHSAIYLLIFLMASSGIVTLMLSGAVPVLLGGGVLPDFSELLPRVAHGIMSKIMIALLLMHVAAALYHQLIRRDRLLGRMGIGAI
jgi:cytochrome b561